MAVFIHTNMMPMEIKFHITTTNTMTLVINTREKARNTPMMKKEIKLLLATATIIERILPVRIGILQLIINPLILSVLHVNSRYKISRIYYKRIECLMLEK